MFKDNITKRKVLSFILAFALLIGFIPMNLVKAADEMNYAKDEAKIEDYNENERYRSTQMEQGNGPSVDFTNLDHEGEFIDGFRYATVEPSDTSSDKTRWGIEIEFDKEKGQRTYTDFIFTNTGNLSSFLDVGNIPANDIGNKLVDDGNFKESTYKSTEEIVIDGFRTQRNLNLYSNGVDLKHINSINNTNTVMAWQGNYKKDHTSGLRATQGPSSSFGFTVNPWPNENDKLSLIKLNGSHTQKEFVQGQTITTKITVENLDDNARERLVGQVYHPVTGEIVPGAEAYINKDDKVVIEMPAGVIDENGNLNIESIFYKDSNYKGLQNLEVKFFTRPRTADEFKAIVKENGAGFYTETGAGTTTINHKGTDVEIDLQGIDRYDHYNLIGEFNINLDDTRYYDQGFIDDNKDDTAKHTSSKVKPGEEFTVELYVPEEKKDKDVFPNQKTPEQMEAAKDANQAVGTIDWQFINKINEGKKPEDQWKLEYDESTLPTTFKITPPKSAKSGEFVAVPLTYTYTNGSTDVHWFHFVVQESSNNRPEYLVQVDYPAIEQKSTPKVPEDDKKLSPVSYSLDGTEFKDDHGNLWNVTIDEETGEVTAKPQDSTKFDGGEKLQVPVIAHYKDKDEPEKVITEEAIAEFVIKERANMTPRYNAAIGKAGDELSSEVILNEEDKFNRRPTKFTLKSDTYTDDKGNTWKVTIDEETGKVTATVPNPEEGKTIDGASLNVPVTAHYYEADGDVEVATREVEVQFMSYGTNGTFDKIEEIPFETKVEKDPDLKKGEIKVITEGKKGSKKVTYTIKDSVVDDTLTKEEIIEKAEDRLIHVGEGVLDGTHKIEEKVEVPFETEVQFDDSLKPGEQKVTQEGIPGEKTRTTTLTIEDGKVTNTEEGEFTETKAPVKQIIKVGRNTDGKVEHKEELPFKYKVEEVDTLKKGEYKIVKPGKVGTKTTTWTIKNSQIEGEPTITEEPAEDALIQVGKGTNDGTHEIVEKKALDYKTVIEYDENLDAGQQEVVKEGNPGEQERTNTLVIKDGKVVETKEGEFKTTKEPQERLIKIGRKPSEGELTKTIEREIPYETKVIYDETLEAGNQVIEKEGKPGKEEVTITQKVKDSKPVGDPTETTKTITEKEDRVVRIGIKPVVKEVELGNNTEYRHNPELKAGEEKVIEEGSKGSVKYTTTFNKETGKLEVNEERVEPKNKVVEFGSKTEGKVRFESDIPFEVEIIKDPDLESGEIITDQEGKLGKKETIVNIENSEEVSREENILEEPIKKIVRVGTKCVVCEVPENPDKPEGPKDPNKPGEEDPKDPEKPGEEDPKNPDKPSEEDPKDPEKPGKEDPKDPNKPGSKDPKDPNKPGSKNPKDSNKPNSKDSKDLSKPGANNSSDPKTGDDGIMYLGGIALVALIAFFFISKRKSKDEE